MISGDSASDHLVAARPLHPITGRFLAQKTFERQFVPFGFGVVDDTGRVGITDADLFNATVDGIRQCRHPPPQWWHGSLSFLRHIAFSAAKFPDAATAAIAAIDTQRADRLRRKQVNRTLAGVLGADELSFATEFASEGAMSAGTSVALNDEQRLVIDLAVEGYNLYLAGSAGTGKTATLLEVKRRLMAMGLRVAVTASTGLAACHLGGHTFHHVFGVSRFRNVLAVEAWTRYDVVIIDEISMLPLAAVANLDRAMRRSRDQPNEPFGGCQVIMSGDFLQLESVADPELDGGRDTAKIFSWTSFRNNFVHVRLQTQVRQSLDPAFESLLAELRVGKLNKDHFTSLVRCTADASDVPVDSQTTTLFATNTEVTERNALMLNRLDGPEMVINPCPPRLRLSSVSTDAIILRAPSRAAAMSTLFTLRQWIFGELAARFPHVVSLGAQVRAYLLTRDDEDREVTLPPGTDDGPTFVCVRVLDDGKQCSNEKPPAGGAPDLPTGPHDTTVDAGGATGPQKTTVEAAPGALSRRGERMLQLSKALTDLVQTALVATGKPMVGGPSDCQASSHGAPPESTKCRSNPSWEETAFLYESFDSLTADECPAEELYVEIDASDPRAELTDATDAHIELDVVAESELPPAGPALASSPPPSSPVVRGKSPKRGAPEMNLVNWELERTLSEDQQAKTATMKHDAALQRELSRHPILAASLQLKIGALVLLRVNLTDVLVNGSCGTVVGFCPAHWAGSTVAASDVHPASSWLFPRRQDTAPFVDEYIHEQRLTFGVDIPCLPVVRFAGMSQDVVVPPWPVTCGGTAVTEYFAFRSLAIPLTLAYAFTIHKVQGLTLHNSVVIDLSKMWNCRHVVYVACSRVKSSKQLTLLNFKRDHVAVDPAAVAFDASIVSVGVAAQAAESGTLEQCRSSRSRGAEPLSVELVHGADD